MLMIFNSSLTLDFIIRDMLEPQNVNLTIDKESRINPIYSNVYGPCDF